MAASQALVSRGRLDLGAVLRPNRLRKSAEESQRPPVASYLSVGARAIRASCKKQTEKVKRLKDACSFTPSWKGSVAGLALRAAKSGSGKGKLQVDAVLEKSSGPPGSSNGPMDSARAALERLFVQAQRHEQRVGDPGYVAEAELEEAVNVLEVDLNAALEALRTKEEELRAAEDAVKSDQWELQIARSALLQREKQLDASRQSHVGRKDELARVQQELAIQATEVHKTKLALRDREQEVRAVQEALTKKQQDLLQANYRLSEKDDALTVATNTLRTRETELGSALEKAAAKEEQLGAAQARLSVQEKEIFSLKEDLQIKQDKLRMTETDLEKRAMSWLSAQDEMKTLEKELSNSRHTGGITKKELDNAKALLTDVQKELQASQSAVMKFRQEVKEQSTLLDKKDKELVSLRQSFKAVEAELSQAKRDLAKESALLKSARSDYEKKERQYRELKLEADKTQEELKKERKALKETTAEINGLKKDLRTKDALLSDAQLALQLKEAELVGGKLELQQLKTDLSSAQMAFNDRGLDVQAAKKQAEGLQRDLVHVKARLKVKEEQLAKMTRLVREKDSQLAVAKADLNVNRTQLSEATNVVEQITALSKALAESAAEGALRGVSLDESSVLMQTNYELFAANRMLLDREMELQQMQESEVENTLRRQEIEAELEAVKECLREKDLELAQARTVLASKDEELWRMLNRWEAREGQLAVLRQEVMDEAKGLTTLHTLVAQQARATTAEKKADQSSGDAVVEQLELEVARLDADTSLAALRGLADLSRELLEECQVDGTCRDPEMFTAGSFDINQTGNWTSQASAPATIRKAPMDETAVVAQVDEAELQRLEELRAQLSEKDAALELAKNAMDSLTRLTRKLVSEAGMETLNSGLEFAPAV